MTAADDPRRPHLADAFPSPRELGAVERLLRQVLNEGVVIRNAEARIVYVDPEASELLRMSPAELVGSSSLDSRWRAVTVDGEPHPGEEHPAVRSSTTPTPCSADSMTSCRRNAPTCS